MPDPDDFEKDVFISYHPANQEWVEETLLQRLEQAGLRVAINYRDFEPGAWVSENIQRAVERSRHTLLVLTPAYLDGPWNDFEARLATAVDPASRQRRLIPLLLEPCKLPRAISALTYVDFTGSDEKDRAEMLRLLRALTTKARIFISFKRGAEPDASLAARLGESLGRDGHVVFTDEDVPIGMSAREGVQHRIARCNYLIVLLSEKSALDEAIPGQVAFARAQFGQAGKGRVLPVRVNYQDALPKALGDYLNGIASALWRDRDDDEQVTRKLLNAITELAALGPAAVKGGEITPESISSSAKLWPNGSVISVGFLDGEPSLHWKVAKAILEWTRYANLRIVFGDVKEAGIRISFKQDLGSWSFQGTDALTIPKDQPTANFGWLLDSSPDEEIRAVVLHEFGHTLGLVHEHQVASADIPWNKETVYSIYTGPPNYWTRQVVDMNLFQKYGADYFPVEKEFDPKSVMAFPIPKAMTDGNFEIGQNKTLSEKDKEFIGKLYPSLPGATDAVKPHGPA